MHVFLKISSEPNQKYNPGYGSDFDVYYFSCEDPTFSNGDCWNMYCSHHAQNNALNYRMNQLTLYFILSSNFAFLSNQVRVKKASMTYFSFSMNT